MALNGSFRYWVGGVPMTLLRVIGTPPKAHKNTQINYTHPICEMFQETRLLSRISNFVKVNERAIYRSHQYY